MEERKLALKRDSLHYEKEEHAFRQQLKRESGDANEEVEVLKKQAAEQEARYQALLAEMDRKEMEHSRVVSEKDEEIETLRGESSVLQDQIGALRGEVAFLQAKSKKEATELEKEKKNVEMLTGDLRLVQAELDAVQQDGVAKDTRIAELEKRGKGLDGALPLTLEGLLGEVKRLEASSVFKRLEAVRDRTCCFLDVASEFCFISENEIKKHSALLNLFNRYHHSPVGERGRGRDAAEHDARISVSGWTCGYTITSNF